MLQLLVIGLCMWGRGEEKTREREDVKQIEVH